MANKIDINRNKENILLNKELTEIRKQKLLQAGIKT